MNICAAADIHYPREGHEWSASLARTMCESGADVLVLAGDISVGHSKQYRKFLSLFDDFAGPKLVVPGNHDLWSSSRQPNTRRRYRTSLRHIVEDSGFHYLPGDPLMVEDVGFVGVAGWYDYSFRQSEPPVPGLRVTPLRATRGEMATQLLPMNERVRIPWEELTDDDYAGKALIWEDGGRPQSLVWNDGIYVDWRAGDESVARKHSEEVLRDVAKLGDTARRLVGICHFIPFEELLGGPHEDVSFAYCRAYMGSPLLGEAFASDARFQLVLCGHAHKRKVIEKGEMVVANCSVGDQNAGPLLLTLPEGDDG